MKKLLLTLALAVACILPAKAQTDTPKLFGGIPEKIIAVGKDWLAVNTNALTTARWTVAPYVTYAPTAPDKFGGGVFAMYEVTQYLGTGIGLDYLGQLTMPSGNITLKLPIKPFARLGWDKEFTPFAIGALAIPVSGAGDDNGPVATIVGAGVSTKLFEMKGKPVTGGFAVVDWQNAGEYSGRHWQAFLAWHF